MTRQLLLGMALLASLQPPAIAAKGAKTSGKGKADAAKGAAGPQAKFATYEEARATAQPAGDLARLVEPLFATCPGPADKDDLSKRQCEIIRQSALGRLSTRRWIAFADGIALQQQPYDSATKSLTIAINGCLACSKPLPIAGAPRIIATGPLKGMEEGAPVGVDVAFHELPFESADRAKLWTEKSRPRLRTEFVFGVGAPFEDKTQKGVSIQVIGQRVYNACTGDVVESVPPSKDKVKVATRDPSICPAEGALSDEEEEILRREKDLPDTISRDDVKKIMEPVQNRVYECGDEFELKPGVARVHLIVTGKGPNPPDFKFTVGEPYDKGDAHLCISAALKEAKFPKFKSKAPPAEIDYPFVLRR